MAEYTASSAMLEALEAAGVTHLFVNLGSDHPAIMEAISKRKGDGKQGLKFITAPNEFVGLCAAQGFFQASGKMQAIIVHVDAGTLAMAGALHNVSRARIPVIMIAGTSPITDENELVGTRNVGHFATSRAKKTRSLTFYGRNSSTTSKTPLTSGGL